ncbi:MAG: hypothetical protein MHM6MM_004737 [Cercozoa sp. M6MM]
MMMRNKLERERQRVLVTGGAGFVGSHLVDRLMEMGCEVIVVDSLYSGCKSNLRRWLRHERFEFVRHDVAQPLHGINVDRIYHLASPASPVFYQHNEIKTLKTNFLGTLNMLGMARCTDARFLFTSTSEVYGDPEQSPQHESYRGNVNVNGVRACYDEGKRVAESLVMSYHRCHGVDTRIARLFNTYGPRMQRFDGRVISNFCVQALQHEPLTVYGDGTQTRSFCYVSDTVDALIALMEAEEPNVHAPVNIGNPHEITINQLVDAVRNACVDVTGQETLSEVEFMELPSDDPKRRCPDISRATELLDWTPTVALEEGLRKTLSYFDEHFGCSGSEDST